MKQHNSKKVMFIFSLHIHYLSERVYVIVVKFIGGLCSRCKIYMGGGGDYVHFAKFKGDYVHLYKNKRRGVVRGILPYTLLSKQYQSAVDT